ncbi:MAG TPA: lysine--tRNA ligase [Planctomycetota bacterium]|nr:lysine--tRNA ligase [Planctomycetota bacterium]
MEEDLRELRIGKLDRLRAAGIPTNPERFERTHALAEALSLPEGTGGLRLAGRLIAVRTFGKLTFAHLQDRSGRLQIALKRQDLPPEVWQAFHELYDRGDFVGAEGAIFRTQTGEITLAVEKLHFLGKALLPLPEKWHGLKDTELRQRRRYLDLLTSDETRERFRMRTRVLRTLRSFLDTHGFEEVETPVLQTVPSGASARPFVTHHNALDLDVYLSISPETWLKRLVVGGYEKVYEIARCFRNEGMDPSHLQDFTMLEFYVAYWSYEDNMRFTEKLMRHLLREVLGKDKLDWRGRVIDFSGEWPRVDMGTLLRERTGIDIARCPTADELRGAIAAKGIKLERIDLGRGALIDALYKATVRDELIQPCFLTGIPSDILPLARRNDGDPGLADCFQLLVNGWEIVKAYSELVDPLEQRRRFEEQEKERERGDDEAMFVDEEYLLAMEHGMPPISGWGMGIDRLCALLSGSDSLRDVVFFPLLRPKGGGAGEGNTDDSGDVAGFPLSREQAMRLFDENVKSDFLRKHCLASAAVMEAIAERFRKDRDTFWCMGLLHDLDFDRVKEPTKHTRETVEILRAHGVRDERILKAILSHNEALGVDRTAWLDFALSCGETITGLVMASALVLPDKKLQSLEGKSVVKRMKKKDFAKQVSREAILQCERIGLSIDEFCDLAVGALRRIAPELGL